ncbi:MAG TPA: hypothetical protein VFY69_07760 [Solirubrobacterales bacterium]|nr:hypothetical protein [Solirubrobacterales bacterium]
MPRRALLSLAIALMLVVPAAIAGAAKIGGPDPATRVWTEWPHRVTCGWGHSFDPVAVFSGPAGAERGKLPSERALRRFLAREILDWVPKHGWRRLAESNGYAQFAAGRLRRGVETMTFRRVKGRWKWQSYSGGCLPGTVRRGIPAITWDLASDQPPLTPETRSILVELGPGECSSGKPKAPRLQKPEIREQNGALLLSLWVRPLPPGFYTCEGIVEPPVRIELPEPLGERELLDGGTYPPRPAAEPDPER